MNLIKLKTKEEINKIRKSCEILSKMIGYIGKHINPGISLLELDSLAEEFIRDNGAIPTFKGYPNPNGLPFPATLCTSVNDEVVHGIPNNRPLQEGDIVSVDCGTYMNGFCGDSAYTFCVGEVSPEIKQLLKTTKEALYLGIENAVHGKRLGDISFAVQNHCEANSYGVVREFVGHGIGKDMHEDPQVPNYGRRGYGTLLKKGMCLAIEPMITLGSRQLQMDRDGWTVRTRDGKCAAHFEHTIAVRQGKADILSSFEYIEQVLGDKAI
jgi:methionyl aminopeptidase